MSVTATLMGGCANQMFIYATALALARRLGTDLRLDVSRYDNPGEYRMYSLGLFAGVVEPTVRGGTGKLIREQGMPYNPALFEDAPSDCTLCGYWQCFRYFNDFHDELCARFRSRQDLPPESEEILDKILESDRESCFVTVRRSDYVGNNFHGLLPMGYYQEAADIVAARVGNPTFFVFSDDPAWCLNNFHLPAYRVTVAGNFHMTVKPHLGREDAELLLMRSCAHAILANSSYSAMGTYLGNSHTDGIVIAPRSWFGPGSKEDPRDIYAGHWIKL